MTQKNINRLIVAVVQEQDAESAISALTQAGYIASRLSSTGGFLGRQNVTLLVGMSEGDEAEVVETLRKSCRSRIEYVATSLEGSPFNLPLSTPVVVGGATLFTMTVERFEEI